MENDRKQEQIEAAKQAAAEAKANFELLKTLEIKRQQLMIQIEKQQARAKKVHIEAPEIAQEDVEILASVPEPVQEQVNTLVNIFVNMIILSSDHSSPFFSGSSCWCNCRRRCQGGF